MAAAKKTGKDKAEGAAPASDDQKAPPADSQPAGNPPPETTQPEAGKDKGSYRAVSPLRANRKDFGTGDTVTGLSKEQTAELLAIGVIEKT